jgi:hypothetical protein
LGLPPLKDIKTVQRSRTDIKFLVVLPYAKDSMLYPIRRGTHHFTSIGEKSIIEPLLADDANRGFNAWRLVDATKVVLSAASAAAIR